MATPIGRINQILGDKRITSGEFGRLEEIFFADGGFVDENEFEILAHIYEHPLNPLDWYVFENPDDALCVETALRYQTRTLEQYLEVLREAGLAPKNSPEKLDTISQQAQQEDAALKIVSVTRTGEKGFDLMFEKGGEEISWHFENVGVEEVKEFYDRFELGPNLGEMLQALADYGYERVSGEWDDVVLLGRLMKKAWRERSLQPILNPDDDFLTAIQSTSDEADIEFAEENLETIKKIHCRLDLSRYGLPPIFYGETPSQEQAEGLKAALSALPRAFMSSLIRRGLKIHLLNLDEAQREYYNRHPEFRGVLKVGGYNNGQLIHLFLYDDPRVMAGDLLHEIGHLCLDYMVRQSGADPHYNDGLGSLMDFLTDLFEGFSGDNPPRDKVISSSLGNYANKSPEEWFAEAFAAILLDEWEGINGRVAEIPHLFKNKDKRRNIQDFADHDPVGYDLMLKFFEIFEGRLPGKPYGVLTYGSQFEIELLSHKYPDRDVQTHQLEVWLRSPVRPQPVLRDYARLLRRFEKEEEPLYLNPKWVRAFYDYVGKYLGTPAPLFINRHYISDMLRAHLAFLRGEDTVSPLKEVDRAVEDFLKNIVPVDPLRPNVTSFIDMVLAEAYRLMVVQAGKPEGKRDKRTLDFVQKVLPYLREASNKLKHHDAYRYFEAMLLLIDGRKAEALQAYEAMKKNWPDSLYTRYLQSVLEGTPRPTTP